MKNYKRVQRLFCVVLAFTLLITTVPISVLTVNAVTTQFAGGSGSAEDPYLIETKEHLNNVRNDLDAHYKMIADIVFTAEDFAEGGSFYNNGNGWESIVRTSGHYIYGFTGTFDGNNHYIAGLNIYADSSSLGYVGLFGYVSGKIKDLEMRSVVISLQTHRNTFVGCVTGEASYATISNCKVQGKITVETSPMCEPTYVGGICGYVYESDFANCTNEVDIICGGAFDRVGGICGSVQNGSIKKSSNYGNLKGTYSAGGISGEIMETTISACANLGNVQATGFSGELADFSIASYDGEAGGIVAHSDSKDNVNNCFNNGDITSKGSAGGIVGYAGGASIASSYNAATITAKRQGGLIGWNMSATFKNCYFIDSLSSAIGYGSSISGSTKCTAQELKNAETFVGFNFDTIWEFAEGNAYPYPTLTENPYFDNGFAGGSGTEADPYLIETKEHLNNIRNHLDAHYKLIADIVFTGVDFAVDGAFYNAGIGWKPIGEYGVGVFSGVFDGNGHKITGLYINVESTNANAVGLFGLCTGAEIRNLILGEGSINASAEKSTIYAGGIVGFLQESMVINCSNYCTVIAGDYMSRAGGIVGYATSESSVQTCKNYGAVTATDVAGDSYAGGIAGEICWDSIAETCENIGNISSDYAAGGIAGDIFQRGQIAGSRNSGSVLASNYSGGIVGFSRSSVSACSNSGIIKTASGGSCGGIVGYMNGGKVTTSYNTAEINTSKTASNTGGIAGSSWHGSKIQQCYNSGKINGNNGNSGGIVGWLVYGSRVEFTYNTGDISSSGTKGAIAGYVMTGADAGRIANTLYLETSDAGVGRGADSAVKYTNNQMQEISSYTGWDFESTWEFAEGNTYPYPTLQRNKHYIIDDSYEFTIVFKDSGGSIISESLYHYGETVVEPAPPVKVADNTYSYLFNGWDKIVTDCVCSEIYTATYTPTYIDYTVAFKNWNGDVLSTDTYHYGENVVEPSNPTKDADDIYTYTFAGWDKPVVDCAGDATYTATYTPIYTDYTVAFKDWDGTTLSEKTYHYGDAVVAPADPTKAADYTCSYTFNGWDKDVVNCAGSATYTATYKSTYKDYTVVFQNWDGTVLSTKSYHWDDKVTAPADPTKAASDTFTYEFAGWDRPVVNCAGDATYTAVFEPIYIDYTVIFVDENGTELSKNTYHWGDTVAIPNNPTKVADNTSIYAFKGWDKEVVDCTGDTTYTATYTAIYIDYAVEFKDWNGSTLSWKFYHWGDEVIAPADPVRSADGEYAYSFAGWDREVTACDGNKVYTATYKQWKFADVSNTSWQINPVVYACNRALMAGKGTDDDGNIKFDPNSPISREEFVQVLYNAENKPSVTITNKFPDVGNNAWYKNAVLWANQMNIANGMGNGNFGVGKNITRQDLALMLYKYAALKGLDLTAPTSEINKYADGSKVSGYAQTAMNWAVKNGVLSGKGTAGKPISTFRLDPAGTATRAECAAMLKNFMEAFGL